MNFFDLQESVHRYLGYNTAANRKDVIIQQVRDDLNLALDDILLEMPFHWHLVRESTLAVVANTATYQLNDFTAKLLEVYTADSSAHKVTFIHPRQADRDSSRNTGASGASSGPFEYTWYGKTTTASVEGASGASTGMTVAEGGTAATFGSSGTVLTAANTDGFQIQINGEDMDYTMTRTGDHAGTLSRAAKARLTGVAQGGTGVGYTNVKWAIRPAGKIRIQFLPTPSAAVTVYYRYVKKPSRMMNDSDEPDLPSEHHSTLLARAIMRNAMWKENVNAYNTWKPTYERGMLRVKEENRAENADDEGQLLYESPITIPNRRWWQPGQYFRP